MAENGAVATEVTATVESGPKGPTISDLQAAFDKLSPEEKSKIVQQIDSLSPDEKATIAQIGQNLQQRMAADPTAGRPAAASPPQAAPAPTVQAPAPTPAAPAQAAAPVQGPELPGNDRPPGYASIPEAVYLWTAPGSEGRPLWGLLAQGRKRDAQNSGRLVFKLLKAAHAFNRAGKRILVPAGGFVMMTLTDALEPLLQLALNKEGCAAVWLRTIGEPMPVDGGGFDYAYDVCWESMPGAPGTPRFYPRELLMKKSA